MDEKQDARRENEETANSALMSFHEQGGDVRRSLDERTRRRAFSDIGIGLFLLCMCLLLIAGLMSPSGRRMLYLIVTLVMFLGILLCAYRLFRTAAIVVSTETVLFAVWCLIQSVRQPGWLLWTDFLFLFLPAGSAASMMLFLRESYLVEQQSQTLAEQMKELVLIDQLTGLYNLRGLYIDLERQMAFSERHKNPITLLCIELRYAGELKQILSAREYHTLLQKLARSLEDAVRVEDRVYCTGKDGQFAIILTTDRPNMEVVRQRILTGVQDGDNFRADSGKIIRVELRTAGAQYDPETMKNAAAFRSAAMSELQYDV